MEPNIPQTLYPPASQPPENHLHHLYDQSFCPETYTLNPLITTSDQAIEAAFSSLTISPDFRLHGQTPSFPGLPATHDGVSSANSVPLSMAFREYQQPVFWAWAHSSNGGTDGPFGFVGAHQGLNVGPQRMGFYGSGPYLDAGDHPLKLMKYHQRQYFSDATCSSYECCYFHGKEPLSRKINCYFPILPSTEQSNFSATSSFDSHKLKNFCSSRSSMYHNQHLYRWQQQLTLESMRGKLVSLAKDQLWSDVLKLKLEEGLRKEETEMVLSEVMEFLNDLIKNQFGSHFVQKLFVVCNEEQRTRIILALTKFPFKVINICLTSNGARAMYKLLEKLITPQQISLVMSALSPAATALANDPNGQHVILYCVKHFSGEYNKHLFNEIANNCLKIATNKIGCCVLQSCVENFHGEARERLISEIIANGVHLAEDPYGNYVMQHLLGMRMQDVTADLLRRYEGYFASLSCNKYASNVVEIFLSESGEMHSATIIMELLTSPMASMLLLDPFGNFVIQSALQKSKGHVHDALLNLIQVNVASMQSNLYGKKILACVEKMKLHSS